MLDVILRSCDRVYSVHESSMEVKDRIPGPRVSKLEIILRCVNSLVTSMNQIENGLRLVLVDDHSEGIEKIQEIANRCNHPKIFISMEKTGNGASMKACNHWARDEGRDNFFFVEDDYLHDVGCIPEMLFELDFFKMKLNHEIALFPYDNIDNYIQAEKNNVPCFMSLGQRRHWRTIINSTGTFLCSRIILERYWYLFERMADYGTDPSVNEDNSRNVIWTGPYKNAGGAYLLSPIPTLSLHFHFKEHLSPFVDWRDWWERNGIK